MDSENFKGYVLTIGFGVIVLAGVIFLLLQWGLTCQVNLPGMPTYHVSTLWVMLGSMVAGPLFLGAIKLTVRGARALHRARRREAAASSGSGDGASNPSGRSR